MNVADTEVIDISDIKEKSINNVTSALCVILFFGCSRCDVSWSHSLKGVRPHDDR